MEAFSSVCLWGGLLLLLVAGYLGFDRWPGHREAAEVSGAIGLVGQGVDSVIDTDRRNAEQLDCFGIMSADERAACLDEQSSVDVTGWIGTFIGDLLGNILLSALALGLGWVLAKLVPGHGPEG